MLKGIRPPASAGAIAGADTSDIHREVTINDAAPQIRYQLTKRTTQDEIQRRTSTVIVNRGRYMAPGTPPDAVEKPLHLRITPASTLPPVWTLACISAEGVVDPLYMSQCCRYLIDWCFVVHPFDLYGQT